MKIKNLKVKNFKSCPDGVYALSGINVLLGKNGKGKSSLQMALRYLLNGNLPENPIRYGEDHLSVSAVIDDGQNTSIGRECYLADTFRLNGEDVKEKVFFQNVSEKQNECQRYGIHITAGPASNHYFYGKDESVLWEFLSTGKVEGSRIMGAKELEVNFADGSSFYLRKSQPSKCTINEKKVSAKALDKLLEDRMQGRIEALDITTSSEVMAGMEMSDFAKYLVSIIPITMDFDKLKELSHLTEEEAAVLVDLFPKAPEPISISDVAKVYKILFEVRTGLNRQRKEWYQRSMFGGQLPLPDINEIQTEMEQMNQKIGAAKELDNAWKVYKNRIDERNRALQTYHAWVANYNDMGKVPYYDQKALQEIQNAENTMRQNIELIVRNISSMKQASEPLKKMLTNLDSKICPLCDRLACNTDKTSCKADIEENIQNIQKSVCEAEKQYAEMVRQLNEILQTRDQMNETVYRYNEKLNLYNRIQELKKSIPDIPKEPAPVADVGKILAKSEKYRNYTQQISVFNECQNAYKKYQELERQYELYCSLVVKAEPKKGMLTNTILEFLLQPFRSHVNGFSKTVFSDTEVRFDMGENGLEVKYRPHGRNCFLPLKALSDGERLLAVFTLMDMISSISGSRILVFDRMESMDEDAIISLLNTLLTQEVAERYDHIVIASVAHDSIVNTISRYKGSIRIFNF